MNARATKRREFLNAIVDFVKINKKSSSKEIIAQFSEEYHATTIAAAIRELVTAGRVQRISFARYGPGAAIPVPLAAKLDDQLTQEILQLLQTNGDTYTLAQLSTIFPYVHSATILRRLKDLMGNDLAVRVGHGTYQLKRAPHKVDLQPDPPAPDPVALVPFVEVAKVEPPVFQPGSWMDFYEQIVEETAIESIFSDRRQSITQCVIAAQNNVLSRLHRPDITRSISGLSDLPADFMARFEAARTRQFDELTAPAAPRVLPAHDTRPRIEEASTEEVLVEVARRLARLLEGHLTPSAPPQASPGQSAAITAPVVAQRRDPLRVCIVGAIESQHRHIQEDYKISEWVRERSLALYFANKDKPKLGIPPSCDTVLIWADKISHSTFGKIIQAVGRNRVFYISGISGIKDSIAKALTHYQHAVH